MTSLSQWSVLTTLKNVENRLCVDCKIPLTKTEAYCTSYGTWMCSSCASCHQTLFGLEKSWYRHALTDQLSEDEVEFLLNDTSIASSGNAGFNGLYERYIPDSWSRLHASCTAKERNMWIRAKYSAELFTMPSYGNDHTAVPGSGLGSGPAPKKKKKARDLTNPSVLPSRIVDHFLVVAAVADVKKIGATPPTLETLAELPVVPAIQACYPQANTYADMALPELLAPFIFPLGTGLSNVEKQPSYFTFVLTDVSGVKLYGSVMHLHELLGPSELVSDLALPASFAKVLEAGQTQTLWPALYVPKALVVLSHYPFFGLLREFLDSVYRISQSPSMLPLERYVINFIAETPLPPQGVMEVNLSLNPGRMLQITRPRKNQLPMIDFSYRPLFMLLSVDNILKVFCALCGEFPVCLVSHNVALLTPVCEALLSFLFPFTWQGAYIPVLPEHMTEILDAPVPYLMGLERAYFDRNEMQEACNRPAMSVFVDLDHDVVHLGREDDMFGGAEGCPEMALVHPNAKLFVKLKQKLVEFGGCTHRCAGHEELLQTVGVSFPDNEHLVPLEGLTDMSTGAGINISHRDSSSRISNGGGKRGSVFVGKGKGGNDIGSPQVGVSTRNVNTSGSQEYCTRVISASAAGKDDLLQPVHNSGSDSFNSQELRFAFLRFFVALLIDYQDYFTEPGAGVQAGARSGDSDAEAGAVPPVDPNDRIAARDAELKALPVFEDEKFLAANGNDEFLKNLLHTQLFNKFTQEKVTALSVAGATAGTDDGGLSSEVRYFDESILSKNNRSRFTLVKASTPFLSDLR